MDNQELVRIFNPLMHQIVTGVMIEQWSVTVLINETTINIEGEWKLTSPEEAIIDNNEALSERHTLKLWLLLGCVVLSVNVVDLLLPKIIFTFSGGWTLELSANDDGYEDWSLTNKRFKAYCNGQNINIFDI